jgi:hypothetical protein
VYSQNRAGKNRVGRRAAVHKNACMKCEIATFEVQLFMVLKLGHFNNQITNK